jgi:hypothetical protein
MSGPPWAHAQPDGVARREVAPIGQHGRAHLDEPPSSGSSLPTVTSRSGHPCSTIATACPLSW